MSRAPRRIIGIARNNAVLAEFDPKASVDGASKSSYVNLINSTMQGILCDGEVQKRELRIRYMGRRP